MNFRSFVNVKRRTASIRSRSSTESLILCMVVTIALEIHMDTDSRSEEVRSVEVLPILEIGYRLEQGSRQ